jgi:hypothetical protein
MMKETTQKQGKEQKVGLSLTKALDAVALLIELDQHFLLLHHL